MLVQVPAVRFGTVSVGMNTAPVGLGMQRGGGAGLPPIPELPPEPLPPDPVAAPPAPLVPDPLFPPAAAAPDTPPRPVLTLVPEPPPVPTLFWALLPRLLDATLKPPEIVPLHALDMKSTEPAMTGRKPPTHAEARDNATICRLCSDRDVPRVNLKGGARLGLCNDSSGARSSGLGRCASGSQPTRAHATMLGCVVVLCANHCRCVWCP
jgi:hypothetical protein